jgi:Tol biopolymer transport system component
MVQVKLATRVATIKRLVYSSFDLSDRISLSGTPNLTVKIARTSSMQEGHQWSPDSVVNEWFNDFRY